MSETTVEYKGKLGAYNHRTEKAKLVCRRFYKHLFKKGVRHSANDSMLRLRKLPKPKPKPSSRQRAIFQFSGPYINSGSFH